MTKQSCRQCIFWPPTRGGSENLIHTYPRQDTLDTPPRPPNTPKIFRRCARLVDCSINAPGARWSSNKKGCRVVWTVKKAQTPSCYNAAASSKKSCWSSTSSIFLKVNPGPLLEIFVNSAPTSLPWMIANLNDLTWNKFPSAKRKNETTIKRKRWNHWGEFWY